MLNNYNYSFIINNNFTPLELSSCDPPFCKNIMKKRAIINYPYNNYFFGTLPKLNPNIVSNTYRSNNRGKINANGFIWRNPKIQTYNLPKSTIKIIK
jgi:hypothetical protein